MRTARREPAKNATFLATTVSSGDRKQFMYLEEGWNKDRGERQRKIDLYIQTTAYYTNYNSNNMNYILLVFLLNTKKLYDNI